MKPEDIPYTVAEVAARQKVTPQRIYQLLREGRITNVRLLGDKYVVGKGYEILPPYRIVRRKR